MCDSNRAPSSAYGGKIFDPLDAKAAERVVRFWCRRADGDDNKDAPSGVYAPDVSPTVPVISMRRIGEALTSLELTETTVKFHRRLGRRPFPSRMLRAASGLTLRAYEKERTRFVQAIGRQGWTSHARRFMACCGAGIITKDCDAQAPNNLRAVPFRCKSRFCPYCQRIRAARLSRGLTEVIRELDTPKFITLTVVHDVSQSLTNRIKHLRDSFRRLRRHPTWSRRVRGGVSVLEITHGRKGWHAHFHIIADSRFIDQCDLADAWLECTGDSWMVDVRAVVNDALSGYLCKYLAKAAANLADDKLDEFVAATKGVRLLNRFGTLYNDPRLKERIEDTPELPRRAAIFGDWTTELIKAAAGDEAAIDIITRSAKHFWDEAEQGRRLEIGAGAEGGIEEKIREWEDATERAMFEDRKKKKQEARDAVTTKPPPDAKPREEHGAQTTRAGQQELAGV